MSRPKPTTLMVTRETLDGFTREINTCQGLFAVTYKGKTFAIVDKNNFTGVLKYPRTTYVNKAHAENLARSLNEQFSTSDFAMVEIEL